MKKQLIDFSKGVLVGIGNIAPGLSGGVIAVVLNVYSRLLKALNELFKKPIRVIKENFGLLAGIVVGALISFLLILRLIELFPIPTMMLFIGFIIGPIPYIYGDVKQEKIKAADIIAFLAVMAAIVGLSLIRTESGSVTDLNMFEMFLIGVIAASTMIIPGVSGTAILMVMGVFTYFVATINGFLDTLLTFQIRDVFFEGLTLVPFAIGIVLGLFLLAKVMTKLFLKYTRTVNYAIIGLLVSCPFSIIVTMLADYKEQMSQNLVVNLIVGALMLVLGTVLSTYMAGIEKKNERV